MVVLRHLVVLKGFGLSGPFDGEASAESASGYSVEHQVPHDAARGSVPARQRESEARRRARELKRLEGVRSTSRLQRSVRGVLIARTEGSREANQGQAIERSRSGQFLDEEGHGGVAAKMPRGF
jgi:hypothetical protein